MGRQRKRDRRPIHLLKPGEELKSESQKRQRRDGDRENPRGPSQGASSNRTRKHGKERQRQRVHLQQVFIARRHDVIGRTPESRQHESCQSRQQRPDPA